MFYKDAKFSNYRARDKRKTAESRTVLNLTFKVPELGEGVVLKWSQRSKSGVSAIQLYYLLGFVANGIQCRLALLSLCLPFDKFTIF
jgi:hypothetical protein